MSYDISMTDKNGQTLKLKHHHKGGTYVLGGNDLAEHNITYNYAKYYKEIFGESGIRILYGKTGEECLPILNKAIDRLGTKISDSYWLPTRGNAGHALLALIDFATKFPKGIFQGD